MKDFLVLTVIESFEEWLLSCPHSCALSPSLTHHSS